MKYPIGIDIGDNNIYAVQLKPRGRDFLVRGLFQRAFERQFDGITTRSNEFVSLLKEISKSGQFVGKSVAVHLHSKDITAIPIRFKVGASESLEEAIVRETARYLPFPLDEAIMDYPSVTSDSPTETGMYRALIVAIRKDHMQQYLTLFQEAGLTVEILDFGASSLHRLHRYFHGSPDNPIILCHIGHTRTLISIESGDSILAQRDILWGNDIIHERIRTNLQLSDEKDQAARLLKQYGLTHEAREDSSNNTQDMAGNKLQEDATSDNIRRTIYQIITPYIDELIFEFHKMFGYARAEEQNPVFDGIYMYGQAVLIPYLDHYFEKSLSIPTKLMNPLKEIPLSPKIYLPEITEGAPFALSLGLAMRAVPWL